MGHARTLKARGTGLAARGAWTRTWIFDLDNTLHDADPHIFPHINQSMTDYLRTELGLEPDAATALRQQYWRRYGATLLGLMRHHGTNPQHFLWHTHQFPELKRMLVREPLLRATVRRLPGRKILFSNGPMHYLRAVLKALGIADLFDAVFSIESTRFRPKPDVSGFVRFVRTNRLHPRRCIMVEDTLANLRTAKKLGIKTVWLSRDRRTPRYVDLKIESLSELRRHLTQLA